METGVGAVGVGAGAYAAGKAYAAGSIGLTVVGGVIFVAGAGLALKGSSI